MVPPPWLVDGFIPSAFREGGVEDGESSQSEGTGEEERTSMEALRGGLERRVLPDQEMKAELESLSNGEIEIEKDGCSFASMAYLASREEALFFRTHLTSITRPLPPIGSFRQVSFEVDA